MRVFFSRQTMIRNEYCAGRRRKRSGASGITFILLCAMCLVLVFATASFAWEEDLPDIEPFDARYASAEGIGALEDRVLRLERRVADLESQVMMQTEALNNLTGHVNTLRAVIVVVATADSFKEARNLAQQKLGMRPVPTTLEKIIIEQYKRVKGNVAIDAKANKVNKNNLINKLKKPAKK